ncbi:hypothetical protein [Mesorhizobium sp. BHbdii]
MDACLQLLRGGAHPAVARRAFVAAALEARILRCDWGISGLAHSAACTASRIFKPGSANACGATTKAPQVPRSCRSHPKWKGKLAKLGLITS